MDFRHVKELIIPEGSVKELRIGGITVWRRPSTGNYSVAITTDNSSAITGAKYKQAFSKTFTADYNVPSTEQDSTPVWTVSGLPSGMSVESLNGDSLTVIGTPSVYGDFTLTVSVTKGSYTDSKEYTLTVEYVAYGVSITTSNASEITTFALGQNASLTFAASFNVPPEEQDITPTWTISGLPSGLNTSGATVSGTASSLGKSTVTVKVTKGSYSDSKTYTFTVYGLEISTSSLPNGYTGVGYSTTLGVKSNLPSGVGSLVYTVSGLPSGLSLDSSSGVISGTPTATGSSTVNVYAMQAPYRSATKSLGLTVYDKSVLAPKWAASSYTVELTAADLLKTDKVGTEVARASVGVSGIGSGDKLAISTTQGTTEGTVRNSSNVITSNTFCSRGASYTMPIIEVSTSYWYGTLTMIFKLTKKTSTAASKWKGTSISFTITVTNGYGSATITIIVKNV